MLLWNHRPVRKPQECTCCSLHQNLSDFLGIGIEVRYLNPPPPPATPSRMPPWSLVKGGLMDWYLGCYRYRTCIWCIGKRTVPSSDWYIFSRYTRNTIRYTFKRGRVGREFFHHLIVSPFLKGQGPTDSRQPLCLFAHGNKGCATNLEYKDSLAFVFCDIMDQQYLPF